MRGGGCQNKRGSREDNKRKEKGKIQIPKKEISRIQKQQKREKTAAGKDQVEPSSQWRRKRSHAVTKKKLWREPWK